MKILGVDFTSTPTKRKAITVARGTLAKKVLRVDAVDRLTSFAEYEAVLMERGPWVGGFDFPFGLPRELVETLEWPRKWPDSMRHFRSLPRSEIRATFDAFRAARPIGRKMAHRETDAHARSHSSMKLVNPPVALMMLEGATRLLEANVTIPSLYVGHPDRVALEAYPALVARMVTRASYKSDEAKKQTPARRRERAKIVRFIGTKNPLGVVVKMPPALERAAIADGTGDLLDAVLCAFQAAIAIGRPRWGLPEDVDPLEGWITLA